MSGEMRFLYDISSTGRLHHSIPEVHTLLDKKINLAPLFAHQIPMKGVFYMTLVPLVDSIFRFLTCTLFLVRKKSYSSGVHFCSSNSGGRRFLYDICSTGRIHLSIPEVHTLLSKKKILLQWCTLSLIKFRWKAFSI